MSNMNLIYIVEPEDMLVPEFDDTETESQAYTPNFTIPSQKAGDVSGIHSGSLSSTTNAAATIGIAASLLVSPIISLPIGLLLGAASARPVISQLLSNDQKALPDVLKEAEAREIEAFLRQHGITIRMAERRGFRFPPGHPQIGQTYKLHPLSGLVGSDKGGVYIPQQGYDELLLEEREAELLRMLVELGATKITISEKQSQKLASNISGSVGAGSKMLGEAKIEASASSEHIQLNQDVRDFELVGKPWVDGSKLDRAKFAWVAFEPSWGALISAREIGQCTKAAIEIKEETSFSSEKRLSLSVTSKLYKGNASGKADNTAQVGKVFYIAAEFAPFRQRTIDQAQPTG